MHVIGLTLVQPHVIHTDTVINRTHQRKRNMLTADQTLSIDLPACYTFVGYAYT